MQNEPDPFVGPRGSRATPARHVDPRARGGRQRRGYEERDPDTGMLPELPTLGEIERRIMRCDDELAQLVEEHYSSAEAAASAEADWKAHRDRCLVAIADGPKGKEAADIREARAKMTRTHPEDVSNPETGDDLYRLYKILEAREKSIDRHIRAVQTRATALMSVAKGIRSVT